MDSQTKMRNSIIEANIWAFVKFEQNDRAWLLPMAEFTYNNAENASISYTPLELNCRYHPRVFYKKNLNLHS